MSGPCRQIIKSESKALNFTCSSNHSERVRKHVSVVKNEIKELDESHRCVDVIAGVAIFVDESHRCLESLQIVIQSNIKTARYRAGTFSHIMDALLGALPSGGFFYPCFFLCFSRSFLFKIFLRNRIASGVTSQYSSSSKYWIASSRDISCVLRIIDV